MVYLATKWWIFPWQTPQKTPARKPLPGTPLSWAWRSWGIIQNLVILKVDWSLNHQKMVDHETTFSYIFCTLFPLFPLFDMFVFFYVSNKWDLIIKHKHHQTMGIECRKCGGFMILLIAYQKGTIFSELWDRSYTINVEKWCMGMGIIHPATHEIDRTSQIKLVLKSIPSPDVSNTMRDPCAWIDPTRSNQGWDLEASCHPAYHQVHQRTCLWIKHAVDMRGSSSWTKLPNSNILSIPWFDARVGSPI